jgi:hypothetical protein
MEKSFTYEELVQYLPSVLDKALASKAITNIFDANSASIVPGDIAGKYKVMKIAFGNGLGDYSRKAGFANGSVSTSWEDITLTQDRATSFQIDTLDNQQAGNMIVYTLSEFLRLKVVPEVDAYRISKYAGAVPSSNWDTAVDTWTAATAYNAFVKAKSKLFNLGVDEEELVLLCTDAFKAKLAEKVGDARLVEGQIADYRVTKLDGVSIIPVPESRFYDSIELSDYSAEGIGGGYKPADDAHVLNFLMFPKSYAINVSQHNRTRIFTPDVNQNADAYKVDYRLFHDAFVLDEKKNAFVGCKRIATVG